MKTSRIVSLVLAAVLAATTMLPAQETRPVDVDVVLDATRARDFDHFECTEPGQIKLEKRR